MASDDEVVKEVEKPASIFCKVMRFLEKLFALLKKRLGTLAIREEIGASSSGTSRPERSREKWVDITDEFFESCQGLELGELAIAPNFSMFEAMSAIELMDPKMDVGLVRTRPDLGFAKCRREGALSLNYLPETLATLDATLSALVTWLEGGSLAQTLYTNVLLVNANLVNKVDILGTFGHAMNQLIYYINNIITTASVSEEEDFNVTNPYPCIPFQKDYKVIRIELEAIEASLESEAKMTNCADDDAAERLVMGSIAARLAFVRTLTQAIINLTPIHTIILDNIDKANPTPVATFRPNLRHTTEDLQTCLKNAVVMADTWHLGSRSERDDEDFAWLPAFEPDLNRRKLPATFPRKAEMIPRKRAIPYLVEMVQMLLRLPMEVPDAVSEPGSMIAYVREYSEAKFSTAFTRSVLQLMLFPLDDHVLGKRALSDLCVDSLKNALAPPLLDTDTGLLGDPGIKNMWSLMVSNMTKAFLLISQVFGSNLPRQREKLVHSISDFCILEMDADDLDKQCLRFCSGSSAPLNYNMQGGLHLGTFFISETLRLMRLYLESSFQQELIAPYEYTYMYWFYGDIVMKWLCSGNDRAYSYLANGLSSTGSKKGKTSVTKVSNKDSRKKTKLREYKAENAFLMIEMAICDGMFRAALALQLMGKIIVPMWEANSEELRFAHRMVPFKQLQPLCDLNYARYRRDSRLDSLVSGGHSQLLSDAVEAFDMARIQLEQGQLSDRYVAKGNSLLKVCKNNIVVLRLFSSGRMPNSRIHFEFTESPAYPMMRLQ